MQLCSVAEVAPKSPLVLVCVKRSPIRYSCRAGEKAIWYNVNIVADPDVEIRWGGGGGGRAVRVTDRHTCFYLESYRINSISTISPNN